MKRINWVSFAWYNNGVFPTKVFSFDDVASKEAGVVWSFDMKYHLKQRYPCIFWIPKVGIKWENGKYVSEKEEYTYHKTT